MTMKLDTVVVILIFVMAFSLMVSTRPNLREPERLPYNPDLIIRR